jgi:hypothetical protein
MFIASLQFLDVKSAKDALDNTIAPSVCLPTTMAGHHGHWGILSPIKSLVPAPWAQLERFLLGLIPGHLSPWEVRITQSILNKLSLLQL